MVIMAVADKIDKLSLIYVKDKKLLVARSKGKDVFYLPGGKRETGESDEQALRREIKEELSVDIKQHTLKYMDSFERQAHGKPEGLMARLTCYSADLNGIPRPSSEIEEIAWLGSKDGDKLPAEWVFLLGWLKGKGLID